MRTKRTTLVIKHTTASDVSCRAGLYLEEEDLYVRRDEEEVGTFANAKVSVEIRNIPVTTKKAIVNPR